MIKFFRRIRQQLLTENKFSKYLIYAIGEIILVVIGIFIALQLNTSKENKEKSDLGYKYLSEMKQEVQGDIFILDYRIRLLEKSIKNQEAALNTKNIATLPLDSVLMIMDRPNIDGFDISELTFIKMKNLGLTALSKSDSLNSQINKYYNSNLVYFKKAMIFTFEKYDEYSNYLAYMEESIDYTSKDYEFPSLYSQSKEALDSINRINRINYIISLKGKNLIINDLDRKRFTLRTLNTIQEQSVTLLKSIYQELKIQNPQMEPLPMLPTEIDFEEIELPKEVLKTYTGKYQSNNSKWKFIVLLEDTHLYLNPDDSEKTEIFPYAKDKFFVKDFFAHIEFNREKGEITSITFDNNGKGNAKKVD
jgi:hypothetical protein